MGVGWAAFASPLPRMPPWKLKALNQYLWSSKNHLKVPAPRNGGCPIAAHRFNSVSELNGDQLERGVTQQQHT